ncbi:hypothetical protein [Streptomyces sp. H27-C3]|uniref:hypothetical protein n=1 Tax=Streptomyces sp. H27-C3 TaxID=3046305 RepID=UPI0024BA48CA|nr:hypothetical protein [Streptomyces sp. H27-C3]MDJ0462796.1 hypothetical protein [Streptomyces sp. H27-C3]
MVLPPDALAVANAANREQGERIGRPFLADAVADGWDRVPADRRRRAVILTQNYGEAGARTLRPGARAAPAYSGHMSFADWGPPPDTADGPVLLVHQDGPTGFRRHFTGCREVGRVDNRHGVEYEEQHAAIVLCSGTSAPWSALWPALRRLY